jgi:hypothetical protein
MKYEIEKLVFESPEDRGYKVKAHYLIEPKGDALVEIFKDGELLRKFLFPAYKVWNIAAHFSDIVDGEIQNNANGYAMAASTGFGGSAKIEPIE